MPENYSLVFPGQGSQYVGMGKDLWEQSAAARRVLATADEVLGFALSEICFAGPEDVLRETANAQPAILAVSVAALAALREALDFDLQPSFTAGHSLGEFSALVAAESLSFPAALRLVRRRGELMSAAGQSQLGAMAAVLGLGDAEVDAACREASSMGIVVVANYNSAGQTVISGDPVAVQRAGELAKAGGARRVIPLSVSGAFHSPLMAYAVQPFRDAVAACDVADPRVPVVGNVEATPLRTAAAVREELQRQIASPVQWARSVEYIAEQGVGLFVEVGPGQVLAGLVKRNRNLRAANVDTLGAARSLAAEWRNEA